MNSFFFVTFLSLGVLASGYSHYYAPAPLGHDGRVVDTPEVAQAKAAHLAAKAAAGSHVDAYVAAPAVYAAVPSAYSNSYAYGPAPTGHDGRVVDTPEVAQAKAEHLAAKAAAGSHAAAYVAAPAVYAAPAYIASAHAYGPAPIGHDGRVVDTPEVAQAKAEHLAAKAAAGSHSAYVAPAVYGSYYAHEAAPIGHDGRVVDTPEVAHAKAAHFAAKAAAGAHHY